MLEIEIMKKRFFLIKKMKAQQFDYRFSLPMKNMHHAISNDILFKYRQAQVSALDLEIYVNHSNGVNQL